MTNYTVLYVRRSDGKLETSIRNKFEKNEPTPEQMDSKADNKGVQDYYRELDSDELKHLDWRRKLAGMLMKKMQGDSFNSSIPYILDDLPENYRLYEHIKSRAADADKGGKPHAGGGHDRQDAYLYGHPLGRKKRYRSPADFFPHLLWLCVDEAGDHDNCHCKICSPDEIQPEDKTPKALKGQPNAVKKEEEKPIPTQTMPIRHPVIEIPVNRPAQSQQQVVQPQVQQQQAASGVQAQTARPSAAQTHGPLPLPGPRSFEQQVDMAYDNFNFRTGELVWFQREGATWGLGVIGRRWVTKTAAAPANKRYLVYPLSHPYDQRPAKVVNHESMLRPWLAWSSPPLTHTGLQNLNLTFETADWPAIANGAYGPPGDMVIDGSILAAKAIDGSYTLLEPAKDMNQSQDPKQQLRTWTGLYLGGERIWCGDAVRIRSNNIEDILVVNAIIEKTTQQYGMPPNTQVSVYGDTYTLKPVAGGANIQSAQDKFLPLRMREDIRVRNEISKAANGLRFEWQLLECRKYVAANEIKGRWYEATTMLPILDTQEVYEQNKRVGRIESVARKLNNRGDCSGGAQRAPPLARKMQRRDAFMTAVHNMTVTVDSIDEPAPQELQQLLSDPRSQYNGASSEVSAVAADQGQQGQPNIDDFVNFDMQDYNANFNSGHQRFFE